MTDENITYEGQADEYEEPTFGAYVLHKKPEESLDKYEAFALPDHSTRLQFTAAADWIRVRGGQVPYIDDHGLLVVSIYPEPDDYTGRDRYYEWIGSGTLITHHPEHHEFSAYGHSMGGNYTLEPVR